MLRPRNLLIAAFALFVLIQLVPVLPYQTNPPVLAEPAWNNGQTRALAVRACFDCHSNQTVWPAYSKVAPVSWLVTRHVIEGRQKLNFSEWGVAPTSTEGAGRRRKNPAEEAPKVIRNGEMPPRDYLLMHPEARLTAAEQQQLIDGLTASLR
jgi:cytochrome c551/c552